MVNKTRVVHCRREPYDVMIDRTTQFGNQFPLSKYSRPESILQYHAWFYRQLEFSPEFKEAVLALKGLTLGCWCAPLACHGDVIVEYLEGLNDEDSNNMS